MIKNLLKSKINNMLSKQKMDDMPKMKGRLEIIATKNGEVVHYDKGDNMVLSWSRQPMVYLMSGEPFSTLGNYYPKNDDSEDKIISRREKEGHSQSINPDGTLFSGEQFFYNNSKYIKDGEIIYNTKPSMPLRSNFEREEESIVEYFPYFPTKLLFGTGVEYSNWGNIPESRKGGPEDEGSYQHENNGSWNEESFNSNINNEDNLPYQVKSINDIYSGPLTEQPKENDVFVKGAIKNCLIANVANKNANTEIDHLTGYANVKNTYKGVGLPAFIYLDRSNKRAFEGGRGAFVTQGNGFTNQQMESQITFSVTMPANDEENGLFYPYNGFLLKQAGLFCDALLTVENNPTEDSSIDSGEKMPFGIIWAKRNIQPIFKAHDTEITARWTFYYEDETINEGSAPLFPGGTRLGSPSNISAIMADLNKIITDPVDASTSIHYEYKMKGTIATAPTEGDLLLLASDIDGIGTLLGDMNIGFFEKGEGYSVDVNNSVFSKYLSMILRDQFDFIKDIIDDEDDAWAIADYNYYSTHSSILDTTKNYLTSTLIEDGNDLKLMILKYEDGEWIDSPLAPDDSFDVVLINIVKDEGVLTSINEEIRTKLLSKLGD